MHIIYASDDASGDASPDASPDTSDGMMYRMISSKYFTTHDSQLPSCLVSPHSWLVKVRTNS